MFCSSLWIAVYLKFTVPRPLFKGAIGHFARLHVAMWAVELLSGKRANSVLNMLPLAIFPIAMIFGALWDLTTMTIPNRLTIALVAAFVLLAPLAGLSLQQIGLHVAAGLAMLVVGMVLFGLGWIGGGDAKFVAAAALWIGWSDLLFYLLVASLLGGALTLALLFFRGLPLPEFMHRRAWIARLHDRSAGVPYGIALAVAGLIVFPRTIWIELAVSTA
ncbi:MAG: prepilin peptidase [Parvibaculum sp.]|uniref:prepilin peptidase n=1 Tax=Parvibaculum sp. TaxID=2024848 RepID=UPI0034A07554